VARLSDPDRRTLSASQICIPTATTATTLTSLEARAKKAAAEAAAVAQAPPASSGNESAPVASRSRCSQNWGMLIKRVYEIDPLARPKWGSQMKVVAFIEPPQGEVIEKILRHCGLWHTPAARPPPDVEGLVHDLDVGFSDSRPVSSHEPRELTCVDIGTFLASLSCRVRQRLGTVPGRRGHGGDARAGTETAAVTRSLPFHRPAFLSKTPLLTLIYHFSWITL